MNTIDLHGVRHSDVGPMMDKFIWDNMKRNSTSIDIITGNSDEMKRIVREIADEYGFEVNESFMNTAVLTMNLAF